MESLARPGGNVTGVTNLTGELGGKRLELFKEAVPKVARVAVLYDPGTAASVRRGERGASRRGARTGVDYFKPWEVRGTDGFEKVFAALNKERPDGLYVSWGPADANANRKRIAGFALKSRLPSIYVQQENS